MDNKEKVARVICARTIRELVKEMNSNGIKKDDVLSLIKDNEQFILIYYV